MTSPGAVSDAEAALRTAAVLPAFRAAIGAQQAQARDTSIIPTAGLKATHTGAALDFYVKYATDLRDRGYRLTGSWDIVYADPGMVAIGAQQSTAKVSACIDYAKHGMVDRSGKPLNRTQKRYDKGVYVLRWVDDAWKLAAHEAGSGPADSC